MQIGDLFEREVTRAIPPVVYFHEQEPAELEREVTEYIITGGYPKGDPRATEDGIHEQFVRLLSNMRRELDNGAKNPACWISGFYGSGKSSFAKLLGLAFDGRKLPSGKALADALLAQDHSPDAGAFRTAWAEMLHAKPALEAMAVVFDVGSRARDDEHVHAVVVRQVQHRLGYSTTSQLVAEYELKLELEKLHDAFMDKVREVHGRPWGELKDSQLAEDYFSAVLHALKPDLYPEPMSWVDSRSGSQFTGKRSADEAASAIADMMKHRAPGKTLFIVIDEVSQYVHDDEDRMLALQSFAMALGERMKGKAWLLATGQQKLEDGAAGATSIVKLKDRFPPALRVHLGVANIRDVVQRRLLRKKKSVESLLGEIFDEHRADLTLHAYKCESIGRDELIDVYPVLPGQFDLISRITTGLRHRSSRAQGDSYAIRGIMQLLGDLFREKQLARLEVGRLVTIDAVYDVLGSALDSDVQLTIGRALDYAEQYAAGQPGDDDLMARVVKAVAMLEIVQEHDKTSPELIARCLYASLGQGNEQPAVEKALDILRGQSFLGYSEQAGYKIESSAGQEWQREREAYSPGAEARSARVMKVLTDLLDETASPKLEKLPLPWLGLFSDGLSSRDVHIKDERKHTVVTVDFQLTRADADQWVARTGAASHRDRIVWVVGETDGIRDAATKLERSAKMIHNYDGRQSSLPHDKQRLLIEERNRLEYASKALAEQVQGAFMAGQIIFRERTIAPRQFGPTFKETLGRFAQTVVLELYPHPTTYVVSEKDIQFLIDNKELSAPPPVLGQDQLGILSLDAGRYEVSCSGRVPADVLAFVKDHGAVQGSSLLATFGAPPHGVLPDVLRACVVGLLRARKLRVEIPGIGELTSVQDEGARELLKEGGLRKAKLSLNTVETLEPRHRNAICAFFKEAFDKDVARDNDAIADAVAGGFASVRQRITEVQERFRALPRGVQYPVTLKKLEDALEACRRDRKVEPTVLAVKKNLTPLGDGMKLLRRMETDLREATITRLREADRALTTEWPGLQSLGAEAAVAEAARRIEVHFATERPWEDVEQLTTDVDALRSAYRERRAAMTAAHAARLDQLQELTKRRPGFDKLDPDQRHEVLRHLRDAAAREEHQLTTPPLEALETFLTTRRDTGEAKARAQLDELLEKGGGSPVVELELSLAGREIETEAELDRMLEELRRRVLHELGAKHRVRLK